MVGSLSNLVIKYQISALSLGKIDKYEYLTGEEILPSDRNRIIEPDKFTYSLLGKTFKKRIKIIEDHGIKQAEADPGRIIEVYIFSTQQDI